MGLLEEKLERNAEKRSRDPYKAPVACHIDSYYLTVGGSAPVPRPCFQGGEGF